MKFEIGILSRETKGSTCQIKLMIGSCVMYIPLWFDLVKPDIYGKQYLKQKEYSFLFDYGLGFAILTWGNKKKYFKDETWMLETRNYLWHIPWKYYVLYAIDYLDLNYEIFKSVRFNLPISHPYLLPDQPVLNVAVLDVNGVELIGKLGVTRTVSILRPRWIRKIPFIKTYSTDTKIHVLLTANDTDPKKCYTKNIVIKADESTSPLSELINYCLTVNQGNGTYLRFLRVI